LDATAIVYHLELHEITAAERAVDGHTGQGKVAEIICDLKTHADRPDMLWLKRSFLADDVALIRRGGLDANNGKVNRGHGFCSATPTQSLAIC
jgi:hypothetical protein